MNDSSVLIVDAGLGNIGSVVAAYDRLGVRITRLQDPPDSSSDFTHLLLPGVGSFFSGMQSLRSCGWESWLNHHWIPSRRPLLGICLGMQLLATQGFEGCADGHPIDGLNYIPGVVKPMQSYTDSILPHVGWNSIHWSDLSTKLSDRVVTGSDLYFVHSYSMHCQDPYNCFAHCSYGFDFPAIVGNIDLNVWGMQFHPEKSQKIGVALLSNFLSLTKC